MEDSLKLAAIDTLARVINTTNGDGELQRIAIDKSKEIIESLGKATGVNTGKCEILPA